MHNLFSPSVIGKYPNFLYGYNLLTSFEATGVSQSFLDTSALKDEDSTLLHCQD
jgi:hypothetical protein